MLEIDEALSVLERIRRCVAEGQSIFDASQDRQWAMAYLWVNVGSLLKQLCRVHGVPLGTEPFSGPIRLRDKLAYGPASRLEPSIVWETSRAYGPRLHAVLSDWGTST